MPRRAWLVLALCVAVVAVVVVGAFATQHRYTSNASATNTATQLDSCALFTQADAQSLIGPAATPGLRPDTTGSCAYLSDAPANTPAPTLITINTYDGEPLPVSESYEGGPAERDTPVRGLGARARWYFYGRGAAGVLDVHDGSHVVRVMVGEADDNRATAIATARTILDRLP